MAFGSGEWVESNYHGRGVVSLRRTVHFYYFCYRPCDRYGFALPSGGILQTMIFIKPMPYTLKYVSPLTSAALARNIMLRMLPTKNRSNVMECLQVKKVRGDI